MPNLLAFDPNQFLGFVVILARISGVMVAAPIFADANVPVQVRAGFALLTSLIFFPIIAVPDIGADPGVLRLGYLLATELGVGLIIGFAARLLLAGVELAGEIAGFQMGLGIITLVDPTDNSQVSLIGQAMGIFASIIFVMLDGHHLFIQALARSYDLIAPGQVALTRMAFDHFMGVAARMFLIGLQVGAPLVVALLAANFAMGLIARSVPQVNVFIVGFPFTIGLGLLFLALVFPFFVQAVARIISDLEEILLIQLRAMG